MQQTWQRLCLGQEHGSATMLLCRSRPHLPAAQAALAASIKGISSNASIGRPALMGGLLRCMWLLR